MISWTEIPLPQLTWSSDPGIVVGATPPASLLGRSLVEASRLIRLGLSSSGGQKHRAAGWCFAALCPTAMEATVVSGKSTTHCDWCHERQRWVLSNTDTHETHVLPEGSWALAWDDADFGFVVATDDVEETEYELEQYLKLSVAQLDNGRRLVLGPEEDSARVRYFIDSASVNFKVQDVGLKLGPTMKLHNIAAACFSRPRYGFAWFFPLVGVYTLLAFDMFSGVASRWAWQMLPRFQKRVDSAVRGQVLRSQAFSKQEQTQDLEQRCLPWHAVSTFALLMLLASWGCDTACIGGLKDLRHRTGSQEFLKSLIATTCGAEPFRVPVYADDEFDYRWPRPPRGEHIFWLNVQAIVWRGASVSQVC